MARIVPVSMPTGPVADALGRFNEHLSTIVASVAGDGKLAELFQKFVDRSIDKREMPTALSAAECDAVFKMSRASRDAGMAKITERVTGSRASLTRTLDALLKKREIPDETKKALAPVYDAFERYLEDYRYQMECANVLEDARTEERRNARFGWLKHIFGHNTTRENFARPARRAEPTRGEIIEVFVDAGQRIEGEFLAQRSFAELEDRLERLKDGPGLNAAMIDLRRAAAGTHVEEAIKRVAGTSPAAVAAASVVGDESKGRTS